MNRPYQPDRAETAKEWSLSPPCSFRGGDKLRPYAFINLKVYTPFSLPKNLPKIFDFMNFFF